LVLPLPPKYSYGLGHSFFEAEFQISGFDSGFRSQSGQRPKPHAKDQRPLKNQMDSTLEVDTQFTYQK